MRVSHYLLWAVCVLLLLAGCFVGLACATCHVLRATDQPPTEQAEPVREQPFHHKHYPN